MLSSFDPTVKWLALIRMTGALGFALSIPFLSLYLHEELGVSMTQVGLMLATAGLFGALASSIGGALSDRFGRRRLLISLMSARAASFIGLAYIVWRSMPFHTFGAVYIVSAILGGSLFTLMDAMLADVTPGERRAEAYGAMRAAGNLGWAFGPAIGGVLVMAGYHMLFLGTALIITVAVIIAGTRLKETWKPYVTEEKSLNQGIIFRDGYLLRFLVVCLVLFLVRGQLLSTTAVHASTNVGLAKSQIGTLFFLNGMMVAFLQVKVTGITNRFKPLTIMGTAGLVYGVGFLVVGIAATHLHMILGIMIVTTAELMEAPTAAAYVSNLAPKGMTGAYMGAFGLVMTLGWTVGPLVGGVLLDVMPTPIGVWAAIAGLAAMAAAGFVLLKRLNPDRAG